MGFGYSLIQALKVSDALILTHILMIQNNFSACGGTIEAAEGIIQSPKYPNAHKNQRSCEWRLIAPRGRRISLKIVDLNMDTRLSGSYLTGLSFYNSKKYASYIRTITEKTNLNLIESSDNELSVFYWAPRTYGRGFQAKFTSNKPSSELTVILFDK